ncbi:hypothetical protein AWC11_17020 [Mycobacterium interjectum]|nr:hypothetical protein AWC11_17020 [Mycobacterium interjectum]
MDYRMGVLQVTRINPQQQRAFQVSTENASIAYSLQNAMMAAGLDAQLKTVSGLNVPHLLQVTITQPSLPDQHAWPGDWILVTDATYDEAANAWTVGPITRAIVYGIGVGQAGSATDFVNTFTGNCELLWTAATVPPDATAEAGLSASIVMAQPTSCNGPFAYVVNLTDETTNTATQVTPTPSIDQAGNVTLALDRNVLTEGHSYHATVTVNATKYDGASATSAATETFTVFDQAPADPAPAD